MQSVFDRLFSKPLFGQRRAEDTKLVEDVAEQNVLAKIIACLDSGMPMREIANILASKEKPKKEATDGR